MGDGEWRVSIYMVALLTSKGSGEADPTLKKFSSFCRSAVTTCFLTLHLRRRNDAGSASSSVALPFVVFSATRPLSCRKRRALLAAARRTLRQRRRQAADPPCCTRCRRRRPIPNLGTALLDVASTSIDEVFLSENSTVPAPPPLTSFHPPPALFLTNRS